jgi:hypothetical protein
VYAPSVSVTYSAARSLKPFVFRGEGPHKTIYGRPEDQPDEDKRTKRYHCEDIDKSDLAFIDTSRFRWYSEYIPVLEATFENQDLCQKMDVFSVSLLDDGVALGDVASNVVHARDFFNTEVSRDQ